MEQDQIPYNAIAGLKIEALLNLYGSRMPESVDLMKDIYQTELFADKQDVHNWLAAREISEYIRNPDNALLMRVYNDVMVDCHIIGIINSIKNKIKGKKFKWVSKKDRKTEDVEMTELFEQDWFYRFMENIIDSEFWWYSVMQLGNWDEQKGFNEMKLIPRQYVNPQKAFIKKYMWVMQATQEPELPTQPSGWNYHEEQFKNFFFECKASNRLGLLDNAAPHALGKKHLLIYTWRLAEQFGIPWRIGSTPTDDIKRREQMERDLKRAGNSMTIVKKPDELIEFEYPSGISAGADVFINPCKYSNNEISKAFAGAAGFFDEKNFVGSAEEGAKLFEEFITYFARKILFSVNSDLKEKLRDGYEYNRFEDLLFMFDNEEKLDIKERIQIFTALLNPQSPYIIEPKTIQDNFGIEVKLKPTPPPEPEETNKEVDDEVKAIYKTGYKRRKLINK